MRIKSLTIENFRAIRRAHLTNLKDTIVIAGPNGCGKSCLFDAIRLLKTAYGGYDPNEFQRWFSEFQISLDRPEELRPLFRDKGQPIRLAATIAFEQSEIDYIRSNALGILRSLAWREISGEPAYHRRRSAADQIRQFGPDVEEKINSQVVALHADLQNEERSCAVEIPPSLQITIAPSPAFMLACSVVHPEVGMFDYQSAQRNYQREQVGGINLNIETDEQRIGQHALYDVQNKYQNIKSQMASGYLRELLAEKAGETAKGRESLIATLKELFRLFFPDKEFLGMQPTRDGRLLFPVRTKDGIEHDINDLSSGEKEVLYGYLRVRNNAPKNSVLLLDEPELHLNPGLIYGLPQFYHKHLGVSQRNQIWLLTHSDVLLKEAIGQDGFSVFHMVTASVGSAGESQLIEVSPAQPIDQALLDLVGEVAAYQPGKKVVIFEGGGDSDFDASMTCELFPELQAAVNTISATRKARVRELHALLQDASARGVLRGKFYSIVDRDSDSGSEDSPARALTWDVYHIENYLLEPKFIFAALNDALRDRAGLGTEAEVLAAIRQCASETMNALVAHELEDWANGRMVNAINTSFDRRATVAAPLLNASIEKSLARLQERVRGELALGEIQGREQQIRERLTASLASSAWQRDFRGRDVLKAFVGRHIGGRMTYEVFRNLVLSKMKEEQFQPPGMRAVVQSVLADGA